MDGHGRLALRGAGAALLVASAAIHLYLYLTGYWSIPVIGWLFLLQVAAGFMLAAAILAGSRLAAAAGTCFALATLGGYLLSVSAGLFGFREVRTTAGIAAGAVEVAAVAALSALALCPASAGAGRVGAGPGPRTRGAAGHGPAGGAVGARLAAGRSVPGLVAGASVIAVAMLTAAGVAAQGGSGPAAAPGAGAGELRAVRVGPVLVLADGAGRTLYWFAPDTPERSGCYGTCAAYWPPVAGRPAPGPGVTGRIGVITRAGGATQATYDGHPLYTYVGDTAPGQARGNGLNLNGGLWHDVVLSR